MTPRGIRLNNPGNIRLSNAKWLGKVPSSDPSFEEFSDAKFGIRAITKIIRNYHKSYGLSTLKGFIDRWAPPNENDTGSYLSHVCKLTDSQPDDDYNVLDDGKLCRLVSAIILHENGVQPYAAATLSAGVEMA